MTTLALTKHHGLGNDFLVAFADGLPADRRWEDLARAVLRSASRNRRGRIARRHAARRHRAGRVVDAAVVGMRLYNADGSEAEMSGNGIRCLVQAWARRAGREAGEVVVSTVAGPRTVGFGPGLDRHSMVATVDMGPITPIVAPAGWPDVGAHAGRPVAHVSVGNSHTVVAVDDVAAVDLALIGRQVPSVNLEIVESGPEPDAVTMRVHERGAGITEACGTGACAAAWAAEAWGLARPSNGEITVHMDGGDARVRLDDPAPGRVTLIGPATFVGSIEVEL